ncbi:MAG: TIGR03435 family protein [Bryobacteraceae bacterium]|jgi:uncharacterized protein (TIGR03435 family)
MKRIAAGIGGAILASCGLFGQAAPPAFEVASVKPAAPQTDGRVMIRMGGDAGQVDYTNVSLKQVLAKAYDVKSYQITGPSWLDSERYDIVAKVPDGVAKEQIPAMLRALLADRFQMKVHRETKEQSVYAIMVGKNGPKLTKYDENASPVFTFNQAGDPLPPPPGGAGRIATAAGRGGGGGSGGAMAKGGAMVSMTSNGATHLQARGSTLAGLADMLSSFMDRPVVDMTGIEGEYDISLEAAAEEMVGMKMTVIGSPGPAGGAPAPAPETAPTASIFTSIQQLGLKLDPRKAPIEYVVVDKAEKVPTEN